VVPHPAQNKSNFSVRWFGFLMVPKNANYTFSIETDTAAVLKLNGEEVIKDRNANDPITNWLK